MQFKAVLLKALIYLRDILLVDLGMSLLVGFTFFFSRNFTFVRFSERLFWIGLGLTLLAAVVAFGASFSGRNFGIPLIIRKPQEAKNLLDHFGDWRAEIDKRQDVSIRLFFIGIGCIFISALVQTFFA